MDVDATNISHEIDHPRIDTASASTDQRVHIPAANVATISDPVSQSQATAIPRKRRYPFGRDEARKRKKTGRFIDVRIYAERNDLEHTHEIQCTLTPDGGLDLVGLSQKMNLATCQASRLDIIPEDGLSLIISHRFWMRSHDPGLTSVVSWKGVPLNCYKRKGDTCEWLVGHFH
jgi:hypothetical protein